MAEIIDLQAEREGRDNNDGQGWFAGEAKCMNCKHTFVCVAPIPSVDIECPECNTFKALPVAFFDAMPGNFVATCGCGNDLFRLIPEGPICINCGDRKPWPNEGE